MYAQTKRKIREFFDKQPFETFRELSDQPGCMLYSKWFNIKTTDSVVLKALKELPDLEIRGNQVRKFYHLKNAVSKNPPPWKQQK